MSVITCEGDQITIQDPLALISLAEHGIRESHDAAQRLWYLNLATVCAQAHYGCDQPAWAAPGVPAPLVESVAILTAAKGIGQGDQGYLAAVAAYAGIVDPARRDALAGLLSRPKPLLLERAVNAPSPTRYLSGVLRKRISAAHRQAPQRHMVELGADDRGGEEKTPRRYVPDLGVDATAGIDCDDYIAALCASGKPNDLALAHDIKAWLAGVTKQEMGDARYQRVLYHMRQPRSRAIAKRSRVVCPHAPGYGVMASPPWFYTNRGRPDSVWHRENARLIR